MTEIRQRKRHSITQVAHMCCVPKELVYNVESGKIKHLDFLQWVALASYYGRVMLEIPFSVHRLEFPVMEVYSMYIRNDQPVQYAAKEAFKLMKDEGC